MMKKRICSLALAALMCTSAISGYAFSDMEGDNYEWAKTAVEEMSAQEIIKGYEDGTFKPDKAVSRQEALVLMSRICGFNDESSEEYKELAKIKYGEKLENYETPYKDEIAYLLYRGIISENDIATYVADSVASFALKRYEAAVLLTKLMGADEEASKKEKFDMTFDDIEAIPGIAKGYVDYVSANEIMNGMGENMFVPMGDVTRAQMATLLYRVMGNRDFSYLSGSYTSYDADNYSLIMIDEEGTSENLTVRKTVPVRLDGAVATMGEIPAGSKIRVTYSGDSIAFVEFISPTFEDTTEGIYMGYDKLENGTVIKVKDPITSITSTYALNSNVAIIKNDKNITVTELKKEDFVKVDIVDGKATFIKAEQKTTEVKGKITDIAIEPEYMLSVEISDEIIEYTVTTSPDVRKNNKAATLEDIMVGDSVTLTLEYGVITDIAATSKTTSKTGILQEITISNTPSIVVRADGVDTRYAVLRTVEIVRNNETAEIYDLRLGDGVSLTVEGETVTKINLTAVEESATTTGVVEYVNTSLGYVRLTGVNEIIFTSNAKVQDKQGKALSIRDVKEGVTVTAFGKKVPGSIEATLLIILD